MSKSWANLQQVKSKSCTSREQIINKSWISHKKSWASYDQVEITHLQLFHLRSSCSQFVYNLFINFHPFFIAWSHKQDIKRSRTSYEKSCTSCEQVINKLWPFNILLSSLDLNGWNLRYISGMSQVYLMYISGIYRVYLRHFSLYLRYILCIS